VVLLAALLLRRGLKSLYFVFQDDLRLRWAHIVDEALSRKRMPERVPWLRMFWNREAAEAALVGRLATVNAREQSILMALFRTWRLLDRRRAQVKRGDWWNQAYSAVVLGRMRSLEALPDLLGLLRHAGRATQVPVLNSLELLAQAGAVEPVVQHMMARAPQQTRPVLSALISCTRNCPERLLPYLEHELPAVRTVAAAALAEVATKAEATALARAAADPEPEVRAKLARALGRAADPACYGALERLSHDQVWYVRLQAADAISLIPIPQATDRLFEILQDKEWPVRQKAAMALCRRVDDPLGLLSRLRAMTSDRYAVEALVDALERAGAIWESLGLLASADSAKQERSQALLSLLVELGKASAARSALEAHPEPSVRQAVLRALSQFPDLSSRQWLRELLQSTTAETEMHSGSQSLLTAEAE